MATMKEVAKLAGVSVAMVSRVLNNNPDVSPEPRSRVPQAVEKLNYKRNRVARSLRAKTSLIIGLVISDIQNPFFTSAVAQPTYELGRTAADLLLKRIADTRRPVKQICLETTLVIRESSGT